MKKTFPVVWAVLLILVSVSVGLADSKGTMQLKVSEEVYVCNCGG